MQKLQLNLGNGGLDTSSGALSIARDNNITLGSDGGLYVPQIIGENVGACDGWTVVERENAPTTDIESGYHEYAIKDGIYLNDRSVQNVYCIGAYQIQSHWIAAGGKQKTFSMNTTLKTAKNIVDEFNYGQEVIGVPEAPYYPMRGDLLMLKNQADAYYQIENSYSDLDSGDACYSKIFNKVYDLIQCWEDMNRYLDDGVNGTKILACLCIDQVKYVIMTPRLRGKTSLLMVYFRATCLWSNLSNLEIGTVYEYIKDTDMPDTTEGTIVTDDPVTPTEQIEVVVEEDPTDTNVREMSADKQIKENTDLTSKNERHVLYDAVNHRYYALKEQYTQFKTTLETEYGKDVDAIESGGEGVYLEKWSTTNFRSRALHNIITVHYKSNNKWGTESITKYASEGPIQKVSWIDYYTFGKGSDPDNPVTYQVPVEQLEERQDDDTLEAGVKTQGADGESVDLTKGTDSQIFENHTFAEIYNNFLVRIQEREVGIIETITKYSTCPELLMAYAGGGAADAVNSSGGTVSAFINALLQVIHMTDLAGKHTYNNSSYVMTDPTTGKKLHGRMDCSGMVKFALDYMGYDVDNIESHLLVEACDTAGENNSPITKGGSASSDWKCIKYTSADQIEPGDILVRNGMCEVGICVANGSKYGFNFSCDDAIQQTQKFVAGILNGTYTDMLSAAVDNAANLGSEGYAWIIRYVGDATAELPASESSSSTPNRVTRTLLQHLQAAGVSQARLNNSSQVMVIQSNGTKHSCYCFEKYGSSWNQIKTSSGYVGDKGVGTTREGLHKSPKGMWNLGVGESGDVVAFGTHPWDHYNSMKMNYVDISQQKPHYWGGRGNKYSKTNPGEPCEEISKYTTAYEYAVIIGYNYGATYQNGGGTCFFLHVSTGVPTWGCVSLPKADMKWVMEWLASDKNPKIVIY